MAKMATLVDDFATQDAGKWTYGAGASATGGQLVEVCDSSYSGDIVSVAGYDLTDSALVVELVQRAGLGNTSTQTYFGIVLSGGDTLFFDIQGLTIVAWAWTDGGTTQTPLVSATYSASKHRWLRMRHAAGVVYWETSVNGLNWSVFASLATALDLTNAKANMGTGFYGVESSPASAIWDNFNLPPAPAPAYVPPRIGAEWLLSSRGPDGRLSGNLPVKSLSAVTRHMGVGAGTATVPYSRLAYNQLTEGSGVALRRNGVVVSSGFLTSIEESWPENSIKVAWVGEETILADRLVIPDPTKPAEYVPQYFGQDAEGNDIYDVRYPWGSDANVVVWWEVSGLASQVMTALINQQLGPTAHASWRVPGLTVGPAPMWGPTCSVKIRYGSPNLLAELRTIASTYGADLGVRVTAGPSGLVAQVVAPVDPRSTARFSAELGNLTSYSFTRTAPTATSVIVAGKPLDEPTNMTLTEPHKAIWGPANTPTVQVESADPITTAWGRRIWTYKDQSSIAADDPDSLRQSAAEELVDNQSTLSLICTLRDTERLKFGVHWNLGHRVTVGVGRPGEPKTTVVDVVREIAFEYGPSGEKITPAIGSPDASALPSLPSRQALNKIRARLAGVERRN